MPKYSVSKNKKVMYGVEADSMLGAMVYVLDRERYEITIVPETDYSIYYQRSKRYSGVKLGNSNLPFQSYGCFTVCLAFIAGIDPLEAMEKIKNAGGYSGALIKSVEAAKALKLDLLAGDDKFIQGKMNNINYMPQFNTIKEVTLGKSQHFVVRLIDKNGNRSIFDPWTGKIQPINFYPFKSYRLFKAK